MRYPGTTCATRRPPNDRGTLNRGRTLSPVERHNPIMSPIQLVNQFDHRIAAAGTLEQLAQVAADIDAARKALERAGVIEKPTPGDKEVKEAIKDAITEPLGLLEKIIVEGVWEGVTEHEVPAGVFAAFKTALWEAVKDTIDERWGAFAKEAAEAIKERNARAILRAGAEAAVALAKSFADKDGLMRRALKHMRGTIDKKMEYSLRKLLEKKLTHLADGVSAVAKLFSSPVYIFLKLTLTSSRVASDAEENYMGFEELKYRVQRRFEELQPALPYTPEPLRLQVPQGPRIAPL
jgi:hypothetical protein